MKPTLTLLALLVAGVIQLQGQGKAQPQPTAKEAAWTALVAAKKADAPAKQGDSAPDPAATPEAVALKDSILASDVLTTREYVIAKNITRANGGKEAVVAATRALAASSKTGDGVVQAKVNVKFWDRDSTGWTDEMVSMRPDMASHVALITGAPTDLQDRVWVEMKNKPLYTPSARKFFKSYRKNLPLTEQIEATQRQKELILSIPDRDARANAWLVELSADLIALELDQP